MCCQQRQRNGFTLVEVIIVIAILVIIASIVWVIFRNVSSNQSVDSASSLVRSVLEDARSRTLAARDDTRYGVHFEAGSTTLFAGATFSDGDPSNEIVLLPKGTQISNTALTGGSSNIVFEHLTGAASATGTIVVSLISDSTATSGIIVQGTGLISMYTGVLQGGTGGGSTGGGPSCNGTFLDQFTAAVFSGNDGSLAWSGDWVEVGESDGASSGDVQITSDIGDSRLRTRDNNNGGEGVEREVDLTGALTAELTYEYRRMNLDSSSDYTIVEVSSNGAAGPWEEVTRHQGPTNDSVYQSASYDIGAYISPQTRIRFKTSSGMGNTDTVWFDNVQIECGS